MPDDYKVHCFGEGQYIQVDTDRFINHTRTIFNTEWQPMPFIYCYQMPEKLPIQPQKCNTMLNIAKILSKPFAMVRVDLYSICGSIIVGELTFTPECGTGKFTPSEYDKKLGDLWL